MYGQMVMCTVQYGVIRGVRKYGIRFFMKLVAHRFKKKNHVEKFEDIKILKSF